MRELSMGQITPGTQAHRFLTFTADQVTLALATPASETAKDDRDLRVFGHIPGLLRFSLISQQWLKETAKTWAAERIGTVETPGHAGSGSLARGRCRSRCAATAPTAAPTRA